MVRKRWQVAQAAPSAVTTSLVLDILWQVALEAAVSVSSAPHDHSRTVARTHWSSFSYTCSPAAATVADMKAAAALAVESRVHHEMRRSSTQGSGRTSATG